jgi:hypothetical protein
VLVADWLVLLLLFNWPIETGGGKGQKVLLLLVVEVVGEFKDHEICTFLFSFLRAQGDVWLWKIAKSHRVKVGEDFNFIYFYIIYTLYNITFQQCCYNDIDTPCDCYDDIDIPCDCYDDIDIPCDCYNDIDIPCGVVIMMLIFLVDIHS